jgi:outer membrane protein OmpU
MKRGLRGTTALIAVAGLAAQDAAAASALQLGITGFYRNTIGGSLGNSPTSKFAGNGPLNQGTGITTAGLGNFDRQNVSMRQEIRVNFTGQTTLDNGITVLVLVGLDGENVAKSGSNDQIERAYAQFSGKFGMIRVGEAYSPLEEDCTVDPGNVTWNFGVNSPWESYSNVGYAQARNQTTGVANVSNTATGYHSTFGVAAMGSIGTCYGIDDTRGNKIIYYSPTIGDFSFGISYEPQAYSRFPGGGLAYGTDVAAPVLGGGANIVSTVVNFSHDFGGGLKLTASGGGEWAFTQYSPAGATVGGKPAWYSAGWQLAFGPWSIGSSAAFYMNYVHVGYAATNASSGDDGWVASVGGAYSNGPWSFGLEGMHGSYQQSGAVITGNPFASASNQLFWAASLNGTYSLGDGVSLEGQIAWTMSDYGTVSGPGFSIPVPAAVGVNATEVHSVEFDLGTVITY